MRKSGPALSLAFSFQLAEVQASPCKDEDHILITNGGCWNALPEADNISIVQGIWTGINVKDTANSLINKSSSSVFSLNYSMVPEQTTIGDIVSYFDELYSYPVNRGIQWEFAYILAALKARDDDQNDQLSLVRFLRSNETVPSGGRLVDAVSAAKIVVESDEKRHIIKLAGIDIADVPTVLRQKIGIF